jgi:hypothetical protein
MKREENETGETRLRKTDKLVENENKKIKKKKIMGESDSYNIARNRHYLGIT